MPPTATEPPEDETEEVPVPFGETPSSRFAADVAYRGRVGEHEYLVQVRHRLLDTTFTVTIDGIEHDPKAEQKQERTATPEEKDGADADERSDDPAGDGLRFRIGENVTVTHCTVRRPDGDGDLADAEVISVRTAGLGGAGEVDVQQDLRRHPLAPDEDSPSAARDRKRTAHPTRYALLAALTKAATFLIPLLGLGALLSGVLDPVISWIARVLSPIGEAIMGVVRPVLEWIDGVMQPVRDFIDTVTSPVREFIANLLQPVVDLLTWLRDLLLGWIPDLSLPFDVPGWVVEVAVPVIVVLVVFAMTFSGLRRRHDKLEAARTSTAQGAAPRAEGTQQSEPAPRGQEPEDQHSAARRGQH